MPRHTKDSSDSLSSSVRENAKYTFFLSFLKIYLFYLFLAVFGLCCCAWAFSSCGERGLLFVVVRGLFVAVASLIAEHGL